MEGRGQFIFPGSRTKLACQRGPLGVGSLEVLMFFLPPYPFIGFPYLHKQEEFKKCGDDS